MICPALSALPKLQRLDMSNNEICSVEAMIPVLTNVASLTHIDLSDNADIGDSGAQVLSAHGVNLQVLALRNCGVTAVGVSKLLQLPALTHCDLCGNNCR